MEFLFLCIRAFSKGNLINNLFNFIEIIMKLKKERKISRVIKNLKI